MKAIIKNPWHRKDSPYSSKEYHLDAPPIFEYRGVTVYKRTRSWMYVLGDTAITERGGFDKSCAPEIIDEILDGKTFSSDTVVEYLRANGHRGMTADEYMIEYRAGRMA